MTRFSSAPPGPLIVLSDNQFRRISQMIYQSAGIVLAGNKRDMVYNRLVRRLRTLGLDDFDRYLALLDNDSAGAEWQAFINALTTNLTAFFREAHHFPILAGHARQRGAEYRVWCAAASSGEEAWSIAMTLADALGTAPGGWRIWASDIDSGVLETAQRGVYRQSELKNLSHQQLQRYFLKGTGPHTGLVRVRPALAERTSFSRINLLDKEYPLSGPFDAIFCRNVMIYFDRATQQAILRRFIPLLKADGLLFAGHSENFSHLISQWRLQGQTVYGLNKERR
ncbi:protein-glutamate O-methyltransferase CheR [Entomohabitans teleogrylli]|uniref:protein-glutamate O-methyltransferase CheR n=1 Tax=Entomohabitans teleogrylli TaxID=1384589 RepID=UPI00073D36B6|nr:protein-glutamate O-methyltransferase CheR [Entomohabitans teleogrylli]